MDTNVESVSTSLCQIAQIHDEVGRFQELLANFHKEYRQQQESMEFLRRCELASNHLFNEHKTHTEELRLINQDINHLEDLIKNVRNSHLGQKVEFARNFQTFRRNLMFTNQNVHELGFPVACFLDEKMLEMPSWLFENNDINQKFIPANTSPLPIVNFSRIFGENNHLTNQFSKIFPQPGPSNVVRSHEDPSKLKNCYFCTREIHRNAPVCPYCKMKSSSLRNPRRSKKNP